MQREQIDRVDHTTVSVAGGLATIGGGVYPSRPIQSSFALVRVPQVKGVRTYANRQEVGRTNRKGDLLIPDLLPYYGNLVNISDEDIPLNYEIRRVQMTIAPPHRGGALVTFPVTRVQITVGTVRLDARGRMTVPAYGELTITAGDERLTSPIGANGEFYFENVAPGRHRAVLEYAGTSCTFEVEIPAAASPVNQIGSVTCVVPEQDKP
jgi:outer membrane usher protein